MSETSAYEPTLPEGTHRALWWWEAEHEEYVHAEQYNNHLLWLRRRWESKLKDNPKLREVVKMARGRQMKHSRRCSNLYFARDK